VSTIRQKIINKEEVGLTQNETGKKLSKSTDKSQEGANRKNTRRENLSGSEFPMSTGEVARLLNIHTNTVRRWSRTGILKTFRVGPRGDRRFMPRDVQRLLQKPT
jgi:excisionase family DNA binding protein